MKFKPLKPPQFVPHLLATCIPFFHAVILEFASLRGELLGYQFHLLLFFGALIASFWTSWMSERHSRLLWSVWGMAVLAGLIYLATCLTSPSFAESGFFPTLATFSQSVVILATAFIASFWQSQLKDRSRLLEILANQEGEKLREMMRLYHEDANFTPLNQRFLQIYLVFASTALVLIFLMGWTLFSSPLLAQILLALALAVNFTLSALFRQFRLQMEALTYGIRYPQRQSQSRMLALIGVMALSVLVAVFSSTGINFWEGDRHQPTEIGPKIVENPAPEVLTSEIEPSQELQVDQKDLLWWIPRLLVFDIFNLPIIWAGLLGLAKFLWAMAPWAILVFLFWPLINIIKKAHLDLRLSRFYILSLFNFWAKALSQFWARLLHRDLKPDFKGPFTATNTELWLSQRPDQGHRTKEHPFLVQIILQILHWGDRQGLRYFSGDTTGEYLKRAQSIFHHDTELFDEINHLLDQGLFGGSELSESQRQRLTHLVKSVTQLKRDRSSDLAIKKTQVDKVE